MRPTDLHFRSPREKTAEFLYPVLTSDGQKILSVKTEGRKGSFSLSRRFPQYEELAKKTGYRVGPGAYNTNQVSIGKAVIKGTPSYHKNHGGKDLANNGYIYVGNSIIFDPAFLNKKAAFISQTDCKVDATQVLSHSPENRVRKSFQETTDSFKRVPWFMKPGELMEDKAYKTSSSFIKNSKKKIKTFRLSKTLKNSPKFF
jgi:hypothetical protein